MHLAPRIVMWFLGFLVNLCTTVLRTCKIVCLVQLNLLSVSCKVYTHVTADQIQKPLNEILLLLTNQCTVFNGVPSKPLSKKLHNEGMGPQGT